MNIRPAAVAGQFYSADANQLQQDIDALLAAANPSASCHQKAIIAPHAGYIYSGATAANLYAGLASNAAKIRKVVLLGPSHRVGFKGIAASNHDYYATPLGQVAIDTEARAKILTLPSTGLLDAAHQDEHSIEVQLPFLQTVLEDFELLPLVVGDVDTQSISDLLAMVWGGEETLIVISSDLSHYLDYDAANSKDALTTSQILSLATNIDTSQACGARPVNGLLQLAKAKGLQIESVSQCNSGDTAGDRDRVVGYGAFLLTENQTSNQDALNLADKQQLLFLARLSISQVLFAEGNYNLNLANFPKPLQQQGAAFVTLNIDGQLRGCIGSLEAHRPLAIDVVQNAQAAAFKDPRFKPLTKEEYELVELHISVLSKPIKMQVTSQAELLDVLVPGQDGLIIEENGTRATFLPSVWQQLETPQRFVSQLRKKAGLDPNNWGDFKAYRYHSNEFM